MNSAELVRSIADGLMSQGMVGRHASYYRRHRELIWVASPRTIFNGSRVAVDLGVSARLLFPGEWPTDAQCQLHTSFERLGGDVPRVAEPSRWPGRGPYFGVVLDPRDPRMSDGERYAAIGFMTREISTVTTQIVTIGQLAVMVRDPDVRRPLMSKELKRMLTEP
ncbi:hypothetical protein [Jatrophihabitans endophyticus]|uniref:hypothetical protein n=1 Tax=Jatrophihabitans endophyticus TaxID=1206085 RepID=UPI00093365A2|nr:hypothetical protein [Jatrophihabitans endophyticus]